MADLERPEPLRALLFLISSLSNGIAGPHRQDNKYSWRSNPYIFAAFRASIVDLLDRLRPPGEIVTPPPGPEQRVVVEEHEPEWPPWRFTFPDSPEEYARDLVEMLIFQAQMQQREEKYREQFGDVFRFSWEDSPYPEAQRLHYGFVDAHRDLNLATQRRKLK